MREFVTKKVTTTVEGEAPRVDLRRSLVKVTCSLCGAVAPRPHDERSRWGGSTYEIAQVLVQLRAGSSYPEGGQHTERGVDVCPACFEEKLLPWLQSQGAVVETEDFDW